MFKCIVQFNDGRFGIRKIGLFGVMYLDLVTSSAKELWWNHWDPYFSDCKVESLDFVKERFAKHKNFDFGKCVK